jgi:hypothetical protein
MKLEKDYKKEVKAVKKYYENLVDEELLLIGFDNTMNFNIKKNYLEYLKEALKNSRYEITTIDTYSMLFNKSKDINYYLKHNIKLEDLKAIQKNTSLVVKDYNTDFPSNTRLTDIIEIASTPIIISNTGVFDLKRKLKDDLTREDCRELVEEQTKNFEAILGLNSSSDIYAVSPYFKNIKNKSKENLYLYNDELKKACKDYEVSYVDSKILEDSKNQEYSLATRILKIMNDKQNKKIPRISTYERPNTINDDLEGMYKDIANDISSKKNKVLTKIIDRK